MDNLDSLLNELKDSVANTTIPRYKNTNKTRGDDLDADTFLNTSFTENPNITNYDNNSLKSNLSGNSYNNNYSSNSYSNKNHINKFLQPNSNYQSNRTNTMNTSTTSALSTNLSELDCLLEELSSANFTGEVDQRNSGLSSQLSTLITQEAAYDLVPPKQGGQLNELDDLMASLSSLNTEEKPFSTKRPSTINNPPSTNNHHLSTNKAPHDVNPRKQTEVQQDDTNTYDNVGAMAGHKLQEGREEEGEDSLNTMMESLNNNLSSQGVQVTTQGSCAACGKMIIGQVITALGQLWHPEHFACTKCKVEIGSGTFFERDSLPYCEQDYHLLFSPRCAHCHQPILDRCVTALDKTWHLEHFCCYTCGKSLAEEAFHEKEGRVFCQFDYLQHFAPRCAMCAEAIGEDFLTALNQQWHPNCFVCYECHTLLGTSSFFEHEGMPYCKLHYHARKGSLCAHCNQPISGRCITAMSLKFHPDHFKCTYCQKVLTKGTFKEEANKPYCHRCFVTLFS